VAVVNVADRVVKGLYRLPRRIGDMHFSRLTKRPPPPLPANRGDANGNGKKPVKNLSFLLYIYARNKNAKGNEPL